MKAPLSPVVAIFLHKKQIKYVIYLEKPNERCIFASRKTNILFDLRILFIKNLGFNKVLFVW